MQKRNARKKGPKEYSEKFLKRFDALYPKFSTEELGPILRKEFPEETKNRSKESGVWRSLANRRGIYRKGKKGNGAIVEDVVNISINPSTPDVELPTCITLGKYAYPIDLLRAIAQGIAAGASVGDAYETAAKQFNTIVDKSRISSLTNFFRLRFNTNLSQFSKVPLEKIDITLQKAQRVELVRSLKKEKWRDLAIIEKSADLFPDLDPLTLEEVNKIRNFWHLGRKENTRKKTPSSFSDLSGALGPLEGTIVAVKSLAKNEDSYMLSIVGPLLQYRETVKLAKAKEILKIILLEDNT